MLFRSMREVEAANKVIVINHGAASAVRVLLKADGVGFSVSEARMMPGTVANLWYKNHWEANYVRSGTALLEDIVGGRRWDLKPGDLYLVGPKDKHRLTSTSEEIFRVVSVFNPPIAGEETHDADNSYPPTGPVPQGQDRMLVRTEEGARAAGLAADLPAGMGRIVHLITRSDQVGFSYSDLHLEPGHRSDHRHPQQASASLVLEGMLTVTDVATRKVHSLGPGDLLCARAGEAFRWEATGPVHLIGVVNPGVV